VGKQSNRTVVVVIRAIGMDQGMQSRKNRHGLKREEEAEQQRGSALPILSETFHGEH
jgi:hypothetical protein